MCPMPDAPSADSATLRATLAAAAAAFALGACGDATDAPRRTLALAECRLPKVALAAQCGEITVPENRDAPGGRTITIAVAVLPANTLNPRADPLFILAGGPGQSATSIAPFAVHLTDVRKDRDIVLVDQRGTGRSSPLDCAAFAPDDTLEATLALDPLPKAKACAAELLGKGVDPAQYTTAAFVADLEAVRSALGYRRINLWGGSYGTRVALEYMRRHPERIRSAVLDGVAPPGMNIVLDIWPSRQAALSTLLAACRSAPSCNAAHPDLEASLAAIARHLGPAGREVAYDDPATGQRRTARLTHDHVLAALQAVLYVPELQSLAPEAIGRAAAGNLAPLSALASLMTADVTRQMSVALHYSVVCAEDAPRIGPEDAARAWAALPARALAERMVAVCAAWPRGKAAPEATVPVASAIPTLLLSGGLDPVTPPANGAEVAKTLARSRHVVATGYGHIVSPHACGPRLIAAFLDHPDFSRLPPGCVAHFEKSARPMLWPDALGPRP